MKIIKTTQHEQEYCVEKDKYIKLWHLESMPYEDQLNDISVNKK
jgi:hypothetical protein